MNPVHVARCYQDQWLVVIIDPSNGRTLSVVEKWDTEKRALRRARKLNLKMRKVN